MVASVVAGDGRALAEPAELRAEQHAEHGWPARGSSSAPGRTCTQRVPPLRRLNGPVLPVHQHVLHLCTRRLHELSAHAGDNDAGMIPRRVPLHEFPAILKKLGQNRASSRLSAIPGRGRPASATARSFVQISTMLRFVNAFTLGQPMFKSPIAGGTAFARIETRLSGGTPDDPSLPASTRKAAR